MSMRQKANGSPAAQLIWLVPALCVLACASGVAITVLSPVHRYTGPGSWISGVVANVLAGITYSTIGALLVSRRVSRGLGIVLCVVGASFALSLLSTQYALQGLLASPGSLPAAAYAAWVSSWVFIAFPAGFGLLFLLFPTGRPPGRWWNAVLVILLAVIVIGLFTEMFVRGELLLRNTEVELHVLNPLGGFIPSGFTYGTPGNVAFGFGLAATFAAFVSVVTRFFRASGVERAQIKWLAYVAVVAAVCIPLALLSPSGRFAVDLSVPGIAFLFVIIALTAGLPTSFGIAVMKYRLYDIDVVISRTLVYGSLAAFITAVYVGIVVGVGTLVGSGGRPNLVLSIIATAIVAVAFQPVRERLQKIANRLVYGKRATPYEVLSQFSERVAESYAADDVLPRMARVLADGTGAARADVWLRAGDILRHAASWPLDSSAAEPARVVGDSLPEMLDTDRAVEVRHQGELLGALTVTKRKGESLTPVEEKLLTDLAAQAGLVLKNVGLTAELLARLEDLRASRQRLVAAQDEERRRLERNLHDGAQQNLVALKVKLGLAEMFAEKDPARAKATLAELKADTDEALETLRDLARGIYPPLLADKGLVAALESQARKATVPIEVAADGIGRYPQDIEAAVYFCCLEALQNVQKYAGAHTATVRLGETDGNLSFEVEDDGKGFDPATAPQGSGLTNMSDRLDALGGSVEIVSEVGAGARLLGSIPVSAAVPV